MFSSLLQRNGNLRGQHCHQLDTGAQNFADDVLDDRRRSGQRGETTTYQVYATDRRFQPLHSSMAAVQTLQVSLFLSFPFSLSSSFKKKKKKKSRPLSLNPRTSGFTH